MSPKQSKSVTAVAKSLVEKAEAVEASSVTQLRFDPVNAGIACNIGLAFLVAFRAVIAKGHSAIDLAEIDRLPELCRALQYAADDVERIKQHETATATEISEGAMEWRRKLLGVATGFAAVGQVSRTELERIEVGAGLVDNMTDVIALVRLLSPVAEQVEAMCGEGSLRQAQALADAALAYQMSVKNRELTAARQAAVDLRDRYAALVARGHDRLRLAVACVTSMREAVEIVPALYGPRKGSKSSEQEAVVDTKPEPAPA